MRPKFEPTHQSGVHIGEGCPHHSLTEPNVEMKTKSGDREYIIWQLIGVLLDYIILRIKSCEKDSSISIRLFISIFCKCELFQAGTYSVLLKLSLLLPEIASESTFTLVLFMIISWRVFRTSLLSLSGAERSQYLFEVMLFVVPTWELSSNAPPLAVRLLVCGYGKPWLLLSLLEAVAIKFGNSFRRSGLIEGAAVQKIPISTSTADQILESYETPGEMLVAVHYWCCCNLQVLSFTWRTWPTRTTRIILAITALQTD